MKDSSGKGVTKEMEKNLTSGSVFQNIVWFSLPYLLSYFLQTLYGMADLFIIGQFEGVAGTTAVSIGSQVMHMITVMIVGLAMGSTVSIAQAVGANNKKQASLSVGNTVTLFMGLSVVLSAVLLLFVRPIVTVMSTPEEAVSGTVLYLIICFLGIPFITAYNIISSIFRGLGDSRSPMYFIAVACVANIVLDYLFIGYFHLGRQVRPWVPRLPRQSAWSLRYLLFPDRNLVLRFAKMIFAQENRLWDSFCRSVFQWHCRTDLFRLRSLLSPLSLTGVD